MAAGAVGGGDDLLVEHDDRLGDFYAERWSGSRSFRGSGNLQLCVLAPRLLENGAAEQSSEKGEEQ